MTKAQKVTAWFVFSVVIISLSYDLFIYVHEGNTSATITHLVIGWSHQYPIVAFLFGFLMGHFYG